MELKSCWVNFVLRTVSRWPVNFVALFPGSQKIQFRPSLRSNPSRSLWFKFFRPSQITIVPSCLSKSPNRNKPHPSKPHPCNMPQAKTEVALQFLECCAAETALQHSLCCNADVICTKSCAAANEKLHCNIEIASLQESGAFLPLSCGFQAPTFRHPRFGLADPNRNH